MNTKKSLITLTLPFLLTLANNGYAEPGVLEQTPLYIGPAVESNIMILNDDSGSMDWEIMSRDADNGGRFTGNQPDGSNPAGSGSVKHRDSDDDGTADCDFEDGWTSGWGSGYLYGVEFESNTYQDDSDDCNTADDEAWRFRNNDYNPLYFDPKKTYEPWSGVDINGDTYTNAPITNAPDNPYNPTEWIDLTQHNSNWAGTDERRATSDRDGDSTPDGFRYYTWSDANSNGLFDNGEETEVLIKNKNTSVQQNFANWFTYHRSREFVAKHALSKSLEDVTGVKIGYATINRNDDVELEVASMNIDPAVGNKRALFNRLFRTDSDHGTPLRENLRDIGLYFECSSGNFFNVSGADCPILPAADFGMCQKNITIMLTDGFYNGSSPGIGNTDANGAGDYDGGDYADSFSNTLADVAMDFYERDLRPGLSNEVPPSGLDDAPHQHMTTYTVAFGVTGQLDPGDIKTPGDLSDSDPSDSGFNWPDPDSNDTGKIDDLWHTAFNGRGNFFSAQNPNELAASIQAAVVSASKGSSSASAVAFNTSSLDTGSTIYQALFNPADNWKGELIATAINLDGSLAASPKWNAGDQLNGQAYSSRQIITYKKDLVTPANSAGIAFKILANLSAKQQADLNRGPAAADSNGQARLDYIRGARTNESTLLKFRDRTNVLGDLVHSSPVFVGQPRANYPDAAPFPTTTAELYSQFKTTHATRNGIIYIGANDGMLHGFDENTGNEVFAYIPNALFSDNANEGLHYLTDPAYAHRYYVDLSPAIADAYINSEWRTILVGGLRAGGRGLFALDVTDPTILASSEANATSIVQWEFTNDDDSDLGYTMSKPVIAKMANGRWAAIVSNGYNSVGGDGRAKLFIIYLDGGQDGVWTLGTDYIKIDTGVGSLITPNGLSAPIAIDTTNDRLADRVYAGDLLGNLWVFDLTDTSASSPDWKVAYKDGTTPTPLFIAKDDSDNPQPITSRPIITRQHEVNTSASNVPNLMVFFGSGQYIVAGDKTSTDTQTFYGVWDYGNDKLERDDLLEQELNSSSSNANNRVMTDHTIDYATTHKGWYFDLPTDGERVTVNPLVRGQLLIFATLIPGSQLCRPEGDGWVMMVNPANGGQPDFTTFDLNRDGVIDDSDRIDGNVVGGFRVGGIPGGLGVIGNLLMVTDDEGNLTSTALNFGPSGKSGRLSWQEILR
ncbi:Type IV fimbrial biogenesis protein PilY1 [hydrothermal vent metagenome]|uniref:Type IV fimbrial biogenesis protein PilY1 n=1 Tax=hydrothermal vent metagenome TaxID=652676 RepID=A0A3B0ZJ05_9ZZZZ